MQQLKGVFAGRNQDCIEFCEEAKSLAPAEYCGPLFANIIRLQASGLVARNMLQEAQIMLLEALQANDRSLDCLLDLAEVSVRKTFYQFNSKCSVIFTLHAVKLVRALDSQPI